jgi:hypothetical protein
MDPVRPIQRVKGNEPRQQGNGNRSAAHRLERVRPLWGIDREQFTVHWRHANDGCCQHQRNLTMTASIPELARSICPPYTNSQPSNRP